MTRDPGVLAAAVPSLETVEPKNVDSPCAKVCVLDEFLVCKGCGRTISEIADWPFMNPSQKSEVLERAGERFKARQERRRAANLVASSSSERP